MFYCERTTLFANSSEEENQADMDGWRPPDWAHKVLMPTFVWRDSTREALEVRQEAQPRVPTVAWLKVNRKAEDSKGTSGIRTHDLLLTRETRCQLRHGAKFSENFWNL
ncbi:hypothetical protein QOT17_010605 [Balamuthia mandrillaris]